jgi:glycopeptide antibiotics resistance protein
MFGISAGVLIIPFLITLIVYLTYNKINNIIKIKIFYLYDVIFIIYCYILIGVLYFPVEIFTNKDLSKVVINIIPFKDIGNLLNGVLSSNIILHIISYMIGNFLLFVPLAFYLLVRFPSKSNKRLFLLIAISMCAEIVQLLLVLITGNVSRVIDITDLILNVCGCLFSWYVFVKLKFVGYDLENRSSCSGT